MRAKIVVSLAEVSWNFRKRPPPRQPVVVPHRPDWAVNRPVSITSSMTLIAHREPIDKSFRALDRRSFDTQYGRIEALIRSQLDPADRLSDFDASNP